MYSKLLCVHYLFTISEVANCFTLNQNSQCLWQFFKGRWKVLLCGYWIASFSSVHNRIFSESFPVSKRKPSKFKNDDVNDEPCSLSFTACKRCSRKKWSKYLGYWNINCLHFKHFFMRQFNVISVFYIIWIRVDETWIYWTTWSVKKLLSLLYYCTWLGEAFVSLNGLQALAGCSSGLWKF